MPQELLNGVAVVNADTDAVEDFLGGFNTPRTAAVTPDGKRVVVTDSAAGEAKVYDAVALGAPLATITNMPDAWGLDVNADGTEAYVVARTPAASANMYVIDLATGSPTQYMVVATVTLLGAQSAQRAVMAGPAGAPTQYIYVTNHNANTVWAIKRSDLSKTAIPLSGGTGPCAMDLDVAGKRLFVVNRTSNSISVIDVNESSGAFHTVTNTITLAAGLDPRSIALHPRGTFGYVGGFGSTNLYTFNMTTLAVGAPIAMQGQNTLMVDPDGTRVYSLHPGADKVSAVNTYKRTFTHLISGGAGFLDRPLTYSPKGITPPATGVDAPVVAGKVSNNLDLRLINCKNDTTGMHTTGQVPITGQTWSCDALGVPSSKGDVLRISLWARANAAGPSTAEIEGVTLDAFQVKNTTSGNLAKCARASACLPWSETPTPLESVHTMSGGTGAGFSVAAGEDVAISYWVLQRN